MNYHVVVEGNVTEKTIYKVWVPFVNPNLTFVNHISLLSNNNFSIISGGGFPNYFSVIEAAIEDVNSYSNIDNLVIVVDSEDYSYDQKRKEINNFLSNFQCNAKIKIIIQHFCIETWALGNQVIIKPNPQSEKLLEYKNFFNVRSKDPELLPAYDKEELNRAQFAIKYLKYALNDKYRNLSYSKNNPKVMLNPKYFERIKQRFEQKGHLNSFNDFLLAFI
jgi:hypothetical protein